MLEITSLENGVVIDHIKVGNGLKIFELLALENLNDEIAIILNAKSKQLGRKDIIKIQNYMNINLDAVAIIDPTATINVIKDDEVIEKKTLELPEEVEGILDCQNPKCISTSERNVKSKFILINKEEKIYKCGYCSHIYDVEE
ncbi:aspartate carbamoyltransferase regulatory subunit [uncultured Anaerococcus sp.]|uniref:aspartate carbamoyltransferase regulatory subunit n=1 Tax=uncultured Anaerococcus sp. TaxID=293428 RepID=UPI002621AEB1|nr:aspartate carbamoyltransferase regulatory subunit [uncultured Anaerococcus sp.]